MRPYVGFRRWDRWDNSPRQGRPRKADYKGAARNEGRKEIQRQLKDN